MYVCKVCSCRSKSLRAYAQHYRFHRNANKVAFPCALNGCSQSFRTYNAFARHIAVCHDDARRSNASGRYSGVAVKFTCTVPLCRQQCSDFSSFIKHIKHHLSSGTGNSVACPYKDCGKMFKLKSSFSAHLSRKHSNSSVHQICDYHLVSPSFDETVSPQNVVSEAADDGDDLSGDDAVEFVDYQEYKQKYFHSMAQFYMLLQSKFHVPVTTINKIVEELCVTHELESQFLQSSLRTMLQRSEMQMEKVDEIIKCVLDNDIFREAHNSENGMLRSDHMRRKYYQDNFSFVAPVQILLGSSTYGSTTVCHYVPIKDILCALLKNDCVMQMINNPLPHNDNVLSDVVDGSLFQTNPFFVANSNCLQLILFQDAFEVVNPIGSAKKKHKLLAVYFTLANFYPYNRSSVAQMQLILLCKESDCRRFGEQKVFGKLLNDLKDLSENGIDVAGKFHFKAAVVCIAGDNLGSHFIGGFVESFSAEYFCRYCLATRNDSLANPFRSYACERNADNYNRALEVVSHDAVQSFQGVKKDSLFNELSYFHATSGLPPCIAHDLFEGVVCYDLALCIDYFCSRQFFSYDILNGRINQFSFVGSDAANKPAEVPLRGDRLGGHAVQNWTF